MTRGVFETGNLDLTALAGRTRRSAAPGSAQGGETGSHAEQCWSSKFAHEWHGVSLSVAPDPVLPGERRTSLVLSGLK